MFSAKYKTALIITSDMLCYPVVIKHPERGFFHAMINKKPYVFWLNRRSNYNLMIGKSPRSPVVAFYTMADATPINFDDMLKFAYFVRLNPGARITPEIAEIILREQSATTCTQGVIHAGQAGDSDPALPGPAGPADSADPSNPSGALPAGQPGQPGQVIIDPANPVDPAGLMDPAPVDAPDPANPRRIIDPAALSAPKRDVYGPDLEMDFKTPTNKKFAAMSKKIRADVDKVRSECVIIDLEQYFDMNKNPDDAARYVEGIMQEYGKRHIVIPPVDFTDALGPRMSDSSGVLGYISEMNRTVNIEYSKMANPTHAANRFWIVMLGIIGLVGAGAAVGYFALTGGGVPPIDFNQYLAEPFAGVLDPITETLDPAVGLIGDAASRATDTVQDLTTPAEPVVSTAPEGGN